LKSENESLKKKIKEIKSENESLNKKVKETNNKINLVKNSNKENGKIFIVNLKEIKEVMIKVYENCNKKFIETENYYEKKFKEMEEKIQRIKLLLNQRKKIRRSSTKGFKIELTKLENEKQKMLTQINNYEINFKARSKELKILKEEIKEKEKIISDLKIEIKESKSNLSEIEADNKALKQQLEMYIIENNGKSKIIEERNEEIKKYKEIVDRHNFS
jgi:N-terminal acetyltransferase B complex non-catalytic subunit